jgi:cyclin D5
MACVQRSVMPWAARLLAIACVSLAAKMDEYQSPALSEFSADGDYEFCCDSIRRMELLVLSTLDWRMGAVTPFDYLPCLSSRLRRGSGGGGGGLIAAKAAALIFSAAEGQLPDKHIDS